MEEYKPKQVSGRVPPGAALLERIQLARPWVPMLARPVVSPLLDAFAAYVAATESRVDDLERKVHRLTATPGSAPL